MLKVTRVLMLITALFASCPVLAQTSGSISGEVRDEKQAVITGATVTVRNISTNETRTAQTNADGRYHFAGVAVGAFIGFGGVAVRQRVKENADVYVTDPDLRAVLPHLL